VERESALAEALGITKRFGPTVALQDVSLQVQRGRSHGLVGRNGAGKSTLVSVLTGMTAPDAGSVRFDGQAAPGLGDREGWRRRVACVYQRSTIIPSLTVAENLFINRQSNARFINWGALRRRASRILDEYQVKVDASSLAGTLDVETRQLVEIARALSVGARFIILDEPTAKLDGAASSRLFGRMRMLQESGVTFLYISHHLQEIYNVCETVTVLRDAQQVRAGSVADISHDQLVEAITGEARLATTAWSRPPLSPAAPSVLEVKSLGLEGSFDDMHLVARAGEVVGIAGSASSGSVGFARSVVGLDKATSGRVSVGGSPMALGSVPASLDAGVGCVPQDRHKEGLVPLLGVAENTTLSIMERLGRFGFVDRRRRKALTTAAIERLDIKTSGTETPVSQLSGGNQQKVVMGRALANEPRLLVLIEPTSGVDVRSKQSLLQVIDDVAREGRTVLVVTDDLEDLRSCDRVVVMYRGQVSKEFAAGWADSDLIAAIEGLSATSTTDETLASGHDPFK